MAKLLELPTDRGICAIPLNHAVYCRDCLTVSNSRPQKCSLCGSDKVMRLEEFLSGKPDPPAQNCRPTGLSLVRAVGMQRTQTEVTSTYGDAASH